MNLKEELFLREKEWRRFFKERSRRLDAREEAIFLRQLSLMMDAGISFLDALTVLKETMEGRASLLAEELAQDLHTGRSLSQAFWRCQDKLSPVAPPLVETGESCGGLVQTLQMAADWAEMAADLRTRVRAALSYPVFVLVVNLALCAVMLIYVFPAFIPLFAGENLPLLTRGLMGVSWLFRSKLFWLVMVLVGMEAFLSLTHAGHQVKLYSMLLKVPFLMDLLRSAARTRFCAVLAVTSRTGVPLMRGFDLAATASGDPDFVRLDGELQAKVRQGEPFSEHFLEHYPTYGLVLSHGLALCQETGNTDVVCAHLTSLFQTETQLRIQQFQALLEPLLVTLVSLTTATLLLAIYWPLGHFLKTLL